MFSNYLKIAIHKLLNSKVYSVISILGLALGLMSCLLIFMFIRYELSYDEQFENYERIYRLSPNYSATNMGPERYPAANAAPLAPLIANNAVSGIEEVARIGGMRALVAVEEHAFQDNNLRWVDKEFFSIFEMHWLAGDSNDLLGPNSTVISASAARRYFGKEDVIGETLLLENNWRLRVVGVFEDIPANSHLSADIVIPMELAWQLLDFNYETFNWAYTDFHTYVRISGDIPIDSIVGDISKLIQTNVDQNIIEGFNLRPKDFSLTATSIQSIHLSSDRDGEFKESGNQTFIFVFAAIGLLVLIIACINFMNLSTTNATRRFREVGLRKSIGADRKELIVQFMAESCLLTFLALCLALASLEVCLPLFSSLINRDLSQVSLFTPEVMGFVITVTLMTGLMSGSYPAFYLSSIKPNKALKGSQSGSLRGVVVRNVLVVFQFSIAITLIIATSVVFLQMKFANSIDLGFKKENVLLLNGSSTKGLGGSWLAFKHAIGQLPEVNGITEGVMQPNAAEARNVRAGGSTDQGSNLFMKRIGADFFDVYDIDLIAGRFFDETRADDYFYPPSATEVDGNSLTGSFIIGASTASKFGWTPEQALDHSMEVSFSADFSVKVSGPIIGVVPDVRFRSIDQAVEPLAYYLPPEKWSNTQYNFNSASISFEQFPTSETLDTVKQLWQQYIPELPFSYSVLDMQFDALYRDQNQQGQVFSIFALLTICIACLGLYGLASFITERRKKEIGVRKVMGGSVWQILFLLTSNFSKLVLIANLFAWPIAYLAMSRWLEQFVYRIDLSPLIFIGSGLIALCIAWVTVGGTAAKAASQKPVLALRYE